MKTKRSTSTITPASRLLNAALVLVAGGRGLPEIPQGTSPLARAEPAAGAGPGVGFEPIGGFALGGRSGMFGRSGYLLLTRPKPLSIWTEVFVDGVSERKRDCGLSSPSRTKIDALRTRTPRRPGSKGSVSTFLQGSATRSRGYAVSKNLR